MRVIRFAAISVGLGLLLMAGSALVFDLGALKPLYERIASHYLEREVRIDGPMSLRIGRIVTASGRGITILGPTPDAEPLARVDYAEAHLALSELFDALIDLQFIAIEGAEIRLEIDETGRGNWPLYPHESEASDLALRVGHSQITGATILVRNAQTDRHYDVAITTMEESAEGEALQLSAEGVINQRPFNTTLSLNGVDSLLTVDHWELDWSGQIGRASFHNTAHVVSLDQLAGSELSVALHTDSANEFLETLSLPLIDEGPIDISLHLDQRDDIAQLDLDAEFGEFSFVGTARTNDPLKLQAGELKLTASGPNLAHLGAIVHTPNWPKVAFEIDILTSRKGKRVSVETLQLSSTALSLQLTGELPDYHAPGTGRLEGFVDIPSLEAWSAVVNLPPQLSGPLKGTLSLVGEGQGADVHLRTETEYLALDIGGRIEPGASMLGSALSVRGQSNRPGHLLGVFTNESPALPPVTFEGQFFIEDADLLQLKGVRLQLGADSILANGDVGWSSKLHATAVNLSVESVDLQATVSPWISSPEKIPSLPATLQGLLTYPAPLRLQIDQGSLSSGAGTGQFSGMLTLDEQNPAVSGIWNLSFPALQPLLTQIEVPQHFEKNLDFRGQATWKRGFIAITDGQLHYGPTELTGDLLIDLKAPKLRFDLRSTTPNLAEYAPTTVVAAPAFSIPIALVAIGELTEEQWSVDTFELNSRQAQVKGSGSLELDGDQFIDSHIDSAIRIANLDTFSEIFSVPLPDTDLELTLDLDSLGGELVIEQFDLRSGDTDLSITGRAENPNDPSVTLDIRSQRVDLTPWIMAHGEHAQPSSATDRLIPDIEIPLSVLKFFEAEISTSINELIGLPRPILNIRSDISIQHQGIKINAMRAENARSGLASLSGELAEDANGIPKLSLLLDGADLVLGIPKAPSEDVNSLPPYGVKLQLTGAGHTTRDLAASLNGYANLTMGSGKVLNAGFSRLTNDFLQELSAALNTTQNQKDTTEINCAAAFVSVNQGKLSGKPAIVVDTPNVKIFSDAEVNFESEKIQVQFKTIPQKGLGISMSSLVNPYIEVTGTLAKPRLSLNPANTVVGGSLAVMTGGISILVRNVLERMGSSGNICATRLRKANEEMSQLDGSP